MKKIAVTAAVLALAAELATATAQLQIRRDLHAEARQLDALAVARAPSFAATGPAPLQPPPAASPPVSAEETREIARLRKRLAQLKARPPGVVDALLQSPRSLGRGTPRQAIETLAAALRDRDMAALDAFVTFSDDTPENREAFMASFSSVVRARYQTPQRLMIEFSFAQVLRDPPVALQVLETHAYSGGAETVTTWSELASGAARRDTIPFTRASEGWTLSAVKLRDPGAIERMQARFDPRTGEILSSK